MVEVGFHDNRYNITNCINLCLTSTETNHCTHRLGASIVLYIRFVIEFSVKHLTRLLEETFSESFILWLLSRVCTVFQLEGSSIIRYCFLKFIT